MIQKIFLLITLALLLPDIYIYRMYIRKAKISRIVKGLYAVPTIVLSAGIIYFYILFTYGFDNNHWEQFGWFSIALYFFMFPKLLFVICSIIGWLFKKILHRSRAPFTSIGLALGSVTAIIILYGSFIGRFNFEVKEVTYTSSQLPAGFDGYRIVQLSDIHIGSWRNETKAIQQMVDLVNAQKPDLILFTGDLVNNRANELNNAETLLSRLKAKNGVYSVLGNHDYGMYYHWSSEQERENNLNNLKERQAEMGWKLLNNEHVILHQNNDSIALIGVENDGEPPFPQHAKLAEAIHGTENMFQLLMSHNPTHWRREVLPQSDIDLMLAGHTHAMQFALKNHSFASLKYPEWSGMYKEEERGLYVNVGIGTVGLPFRFGAWPEITVITLRKK